MCFVLCSVIVCLVLGPVIGSPLYFHVVEFIHARLFNIPFTHCSSAANGVYYLKSNESSEIYPVYCHMSSLSTQCRGGGWTLVMKLDQNKVRIVIVNSK